MQQNHNDLSHLTPEQFEVTQNGATERPFSGKLLNNKEDGMYKCVVCSAPLFSSQVKYDSGSGWPSFWEAVGLDAVELKLDNSHGMVRQEAVCAKCGAHLGHLFPDGPQDKTGERYCINSASLEFEASK